MILKRPYHAPEGDPCARCHQPARKHRIGGHAPLGDPCERCGCADEQHYRTNPPKKESKQKYFVGIDGEGQGREDHRYVMLAWSSSDGTHRRSLEAPEGERLGTVACLDFILAIPNKARIFAFAFGYDLTKLLADLPDDVLYLLHRPELRKRKPGLEKYGPKPVHWNGYTLNKIASKFVVARGKRRRVVWDVFGFYQSKFTSALEDWKISDAETIDKMRAMKDRRADFDQLTRSQILGYCFDECAFMAQLADKLTAAHVEAGLKLRSYYGAGSTASAILKKLGIDKTRRDVPEEMHGAVSQAFFGGRFENARIGEIPGPVWGYDISSAYPYQLTFLPCLECGSWRKTRKRAQLDGTRSQLVRYSLGPIKGKSWGPLPFRLKDGSIAFPAQSGGGWVWGDEYLQAELMYPGAVRFHEAWVYECDCGHVPFAEIPVYYRERLRIGKEGAGIVFKLGPNSCYGKLAQSIGDKPPFQSWAWAGMITSGTRAQLLELVQLHKRQDSVLMVATDGLYSTEKLETPKPRDTGTDTEHKKPLGGWERKEVTKGMFAARPGIYFPLRPTDDEIKQVRARGVGRAVMYSSWRKVVNAWRRGEQTVKIANVTRFHGAKSAISRSLAPERTSWEYTRSENYGQWRTRPIEMSFNPLPKRQHVNPDGSLQLRTFPKSMTSEPYKKSVISPEAMLLRLAAMEALEQPDGDDFADYEEA